MEKAPLWIGFPQSPEEIFIAKAQWQARFTMPTVYGAVDCTHVRICKPMDNGDEYINRKNYASLNVQATCNAEEMFTSISAEWPGSVHDSRILRNSSLCEAMKRVPDGVILGDSGYGITPWLLTPFDKPATEIEVNFNQVYAKERVIIERCFGQLKRRFPILGYKVRTSLDTVLSIITCCAVLHNVSKHLKDDENFPNIEQHDDPTNDEAPPDLIEPTPRRIRSLGQEKRNRIANIIFNR